MLGARKTPIRMGRMGVSLFQEVQAATFNLLTCPAQLPGMLQTGGVKSI